jgi:hypothetical protein
MSGADQEYEHLLQVIETAAAGTAECEHAVSAMEALATAGSVEAAEAVAELFASAGPHRNIEKAYHWYYIALSRQGYDTAFEDLNQTPPYYCGPVGDFRNEAQVSSLVAELGFARARELDKAAEQVLRKIRGA